jgi:hypothetical protein
MKQLYYIKKTRNTEGRYQKAMFSGSLVTGCRDNVSDQPSPTTVLLLIYASTTEKWYGCDYLLILPEVKVT